MVQTVYVRGSGDDVSGDGQSVATAYASPQRAIETRVNGTTEPCLINLGEGEFDVPMIERMRKDKGNFPIFIVADTEAPAETFANFPTFTNVQDKVTYQEVDISPQSFGGVGDGSHWLQEDFGLGLPFGSCSLESSNPVLRAFGTYHKAKALHPYRTRLKAQGDGTFPSDLGNFLLGTNVYVVGCEVETDWDTPLHGFNFSGCRLMTSSNAVFVDCSASNCVIGMDASGAELPRQMRFLGSRRRSLTVSGLVMGQCVLTQGEFFIRLLLRAGTNRPLVVGSPSPASSDGPGFALHGGIDVETAALEAISVTSGSVLKSYNDRMTVEQAETLLHVDNGRVEFNSPAADIVGHVTGDAVKLVGDATVVGLKQAAFGKLTAGGHEVLLGDLIASFLSLPQRNDAVAARAS